MDSQRLKRLLGVVRFAAENSPYYRERFGRLKVEGAEDLRKLPFLTKPDIYENSLPVSERLFTGPYENVYVFASSGTTGRKKYSFYTPAEYETAKAWQVEVLKIAGVGKGDTVAVLHTVGHLDPTFSAMGEVLGRAGATALLISGHVPFEEMVQDMLTFRANAASGEPTFFLKFAEFVEEKKLLLKLDKLLFIGEHFGHDEQVFVQRVLGTKTIVAAAYSSADTGALGYQCERCRGSLYHVLEDYQFIELLDPDTLAPAAPGETGEVVVTNLDRRFMPLIRFRTGDLAAWAEGACPCGRPDRLLTLLGRGDEEIMVFSTTVPTVEFARAISGVPGLSHVFQIEIGSEGGSLRIWLKVERRPGAELPADAAEQVKKNLLGRVEFLREEVGSSMLLDVDVLADGALPRTTSGKIRRVIDRRV